MPAIHLQRPAVMLALALLPILAILWRAACRRVRRASEAIEGASPSEGRNTARGVLRLAALAALIAGLTDPAALGPDEVASAATPVVFILDVSASMEAPDLVPDRLAVAKDAIRELCSVLPDARTGLVAAAGDAAVVCPLTTDHAAFFNLLSQARTDWFGEPGSRLRPALDKAVGLIRECGGPGVVILVSDGEAHGASPQALTSRIKGGGILLHTLVTGSTEGARIPGTPARGPVTTRAQPAQMAEWAEAGGGQSWSVTPGGRLLPRTREDIVPGRLVCGVARAEGAGVRLAPYLYLLAAVLLVLEWLAAG